MPRIAGGGSGAVGFVLKPNSTLAPLLFKELARIAIDLGYEVLVEEDSHLSYALPRELVSGLFNASEGLPAKVIVIGGDGTLLRLSSKAVSATGSVVMGIRVGRRGFLLTVEPYEASDRFRQFLEGKYHIKELNRLSVKVGRQRLPPALNEVALVSADDKVLEATLYVDERPAYTIQGDGVIIATTTGSTAYSLSAGGPLVDASLNAMILTPVNPIDLHVRPVVVSLGSKVTVTVPAQPRRCRVVVDGQHAVSVTPPCKVEVTRHSSPLRIACFGEKSYYERFFSKTMGYP